MRKIKVKRTTDRHYLPHNDLERAAQHFRDRIDERLAADDRKGIAFDILAELVFLAFSVEAKGELPRRQAHGRLEGTCAVLYQARSRAEPPRNQAGSHRPALLDA